jgi:uncharacterized membrane protein YdjX (TVP38/TMEM64 family)
VQAPRPLWQLAVVVGAGVAALTLAGWDLHRVAGDALPALPGRLDDIGRSATQLRAVAHSHPVAFATLFCVAYVVKQTFSFPGSAALNAAAGIAFGGPVGCAVVFVCTALGLSGCYMLSAGWGGHLTRFAWWSRASARVEALFASRPGDVGPFWTILSLRLLVVLPQWALNIAAPHLNLPLATFLPPSVLGLTPYNSLIVVLAATATESLTTGTLLSWRALAVSLLAAATAWAAPRAVAACMRRRSPKLEDARG